MKVWVASIMLAISLVNVGTFVLGSEREDFMSDTDMALTSFEVASTIDGVSQEEGPLTPNSPVHVCHVGHCGFVIKLPSALETPDYHFTEYRLRRTSFADVDLLSKKKPPKA